MIIDFSNRVTLKKVQEMIDEAVRYTTGVINLSTASADQVKEAFQNPEKWMCSVNYSGNTFLERYRTKESGNTINVHFVVPGAYADSPIRKIYDKILPASINTVTGEVIIYNTSNYFAPDVIYDLDIMNTEQLAYLSRRLTHTFAYNNAVRFGATWTYNGKTYVYSVGLKDLFVPFGGNTIVGSAFALENNAIVIYYDFISITGNGTVQHYEFSSNITLTQAQ